MKKAIKMMAYILTMALIITTVMPLSVHAESGAIPTEESYDESTNKHTIIYYNEDGTETIEDDPIIEYSEYEEDGYRYSTIIYASGSTSTECELISAYPDETYIEDEETEEIEEEYLVSTNSYIEDGCLYTEYYYSTGRCKLVVESLDSLTEAPGEEFGDDGSHTITYHLPDGEDYTVDDPIVSEETHIENGVEYTYIEYESGATVTEETYLDEDDYEIITSNPEAEEEIFYDEGDDDDDNYIDESKGAPGDSDEDYYWSYDSKSKKLCIRANESSILNYTRDGKEFPWYDYKDEIELVAIDGIESIYANVFKNYSKLKKVYTNGDLEYMSTYAFIGCDNLSWIYINSYNCELDPDSWTNLMKMNSTYDSKHLFNSFKISCHYDTSASSVYSLCLKNSITCETIESTSTSDGNIFTDIWDSLTGMFKKQPKEEKETQKNSSLTSEEKARARMEDTTYIYQMNEDIKNMSDGNGTTWGGNACIACSVTMMVERRAAYEGYKGDYSYDGAYKLLTDITKNSTYYGDGEPGANGWIYKWPNEAIYNEFVDDEGKSMTAGYTSNREVNEQIIQEEIERHPEGIVVFGEYLINTKGDKSNHAVVVTDYDNLTGLYTVIDTGNGKGEFIKYKLDYNHLVNCGIETTNIHRIYYISHVE